tara:strand:- start:76 stop:408 length:333 start_codon:yes stop_codon:yes gene_type:complete
MNEYTKITERSRDIVRDMGIDAKALDLLNEIESKEYKHPTQKKAAIQCLIIDLLNESDQLRAKAAAFDWICEETPRIGSYSDNSVFVETLSQLFEGETVLEAVNNAIGES